jgi:hypothetical protein
MGKQRKHVLAGLLRYDPVPWLLAAEDEAITTWVRRDLLGERVSVTKLWDTREALRLIRRQRPNGSWRYPTKKPSFYDYDLYETFNSLGELVGKYGCDRRHPAVERGAAYVFSCQAPEGDYRGIYGRQPAHPYTAALLEVLTQAGFGRDPSVLRGYRWLLDTRQDDGGWAVPVRTRDERLVKDWEKVAKSRPIAADRSRPFSHLVTGMVLRALAAHPRHRRSRAAMNAANLLKSRFFEPDKYPDRRGREYWTKFTYPFGFTDLLTSLDSLGKMGHSADDPQIARAIGWFAKQQKRDGSISLVMRRGLSDRRLPYWLGLALCRALRRFEVTG